jgi:hypothetical protein
MNRHDWLKVLSLALGFPSLILGLFFLTDTLVKNKIVEFNVIIIIDLLIILSVLFLMIYYSSNKNKKNRP